jgi:hypothetical protein
MAVGLVVFGVIVVVGGLIGLIIYAIKSGLGDAQREAKENLLRAEKAEARLDIARRGLYQVAGNQTDNTVLAALEALDAIDTYNHNKELNK